MIGLIVNETHILFGEWSSADSTLVDLSYFEFQQPIKEILKSGDAIRNELSKVLNNLSFDGEKVAVAIDDSLLYHNKIDFNESLDESTKQEYLEWKNFQQWGELSKFYSFSAETDPMSNNIIHSVSFPLLLISAIGEFILKRKGKPIWAGSVSSILKNNDNPKLDFSSAVAEVVKRFTTDIPVKLINVLSMLMQNISFDNVLNFFKQTQIQSYKIVMAEKKDINKVKKSNKRDQSKNNKIKRGRHKSNFILPLLFILILTALSYYLFFNEQGKHFFSNLVDNDKVEVSNSLTENYLFLEQQYKQSSALLMMYTNLTSVISPDSLISLNMVDTVGTFEFVGTDSIDIPHIELTNYSIEPMDCCGGIKQKLDFKINNLPIVKSNIQIDTEDIKQHLQNDLMVSDIIIKESILENGLVYDPVIVNVDSLSNIDNVVKYIKITGNNVIVRKINISNTPPVTNISGVFYIAVFKPI